ALAEADAGDFEAALASFRRCETLALGKPVPDERLAALAERRAFELVADRAERAAGRGETDAARKLLRSLTRDHLPAARRTWALARLALLEEQVGRAGEAAALWDRLAESPEFGGEMIPDERGLSWPAGALAARARGRLTPGGGHAGEVR